MLKYFGNIDVCRQLRTENQSIPNFERQILLFHWMNSRVVQRDDMHDDTALEIR